jgi:DNA-binding transcriptional regulator YbjK
VPPRKGRKLPTTDRGRARRTALLEATLRVVARDGAGGVTHRAVAAAARVPLAATTYYFRSRAELLVAAFRHLVDGRITDLEAARRILPDRLSAELAAASWAAVMGGNLRADRARVLAEFEMHLEASRRAELRAIHLRWEAAAMDYFTAAMRALGSPLPEADAALVLSVLTGLEIGELASPTPDAERVLIEPLLRRLLLALAPPTRA